LECFTGLDVRSLDLGCSCRAETLGDSIFVAVHMAATVTIKMIVSLTNGLTVEVQTRAAEKCMSLNLIFSRREI
jgi:hypothetical protein